MHLQPNRGIKLREDRCLQQGKGLECVLGAVSTKQYTNGIIVRQWLDNEKVTPEGHPAPKPPIVKTPDLGSAGYQIAVGVGFRLPDSRLTSASANPISYYTTDLPT